MTRLLSGYGSSIFGVSDWPQKKRNKSARLVFLSRVGPMPWIHSIRYVLAPLECRLCLKFSCVFGRVKFRRLHRAAVLSLIVLKAP